MSYWPWWAGAIALSVVSLLYWFGARRLLGVSGLVNQVLDHKRQRAMHRDRLANPASVTNPTVHWGTSVTFLVTLVVGGLLASLTRGSFEVTGSMGVDFERYFGSGASGALVLLIGGILVGFGTRLGGGCTSGHGLSGCSRFQPGSLVTTLGFFGTAILAAIALAKWGGA